MIYEIYAFLKGPMVWAAFFIFISGSLYRFISMWRLAKTKDSVVFNYFNLYYAARSIAHWVMPFGSVNQRRQPIMTIAVFLFHLCLFAVPLFLSAHGVLFHDAWGTAWGCLPDRVSIFLSWIVIGGCLFFAWRRLMLPHVKYLTSVSDFLILGAVCLPFISGLWAYYQLPAFPAATIVHMASGEILIMMIPFTRLSHMLFFPFTRGYMGSEFGGVRHAKDW